MQTTLITLETKKSAMKILEETARTFFIPISYLPDKIREAVAAVYLLMRAIDEVEDHLFLDKTLKVTILRNISKTIQVCTEESTVQDLTPDWCGVQDQLPEVTLRIGEWCLLPQKDIAPRVIDGAAALADRMANWVECDFKIKTEMDLESYASSVAGALGLTLGDLWAWHEQVKGNRYQIFAFGKGLQAINILKDKHKDKRERGVVFYPEGWSDEDMMKYAERNLEKGRKYLESLPADSAAAEFLRIPLALAFGTFNAIKEGKEKLEREEVTLIVNKCLEMSGV